MKQVVSCSAWRRCGLIERTPSTGEEGRFSVEYVIALAAFGQMLTLDAFEKPISSQIRTWMKRVKKNMIKR
ncbi:hypothetical protein ACEQPO_02815 [Bacillus sp. SL00103]